MEKQLIKSKKEGRKMIEKDKMIQMTEHHLKKAKYALEHNCNKNDISEQENLVNNVEYYQCVLDLIQSTEALDTNRSLTLEEIKEKFMKKPIWDNEEKEWICVDDEWCERLEYTYFGNDQWWKFEFKEGRFFKDEPKV